MNRIRTFTLFIFYITVLLIPCAIWNGTHNAGLIKFLIARTSTLVVAILVVITAYQKRSTPCPDKRILFFSLGFIVYAALRCSASHYCDWVQFGDLSLSFLLFFETFILIDTKQDHLKLFMIWQIAALPVMLYYLIQLAGKDFLVWTPAELVGSTYLNRNALGYYLLCTYPFSLFLLFHLKKWLKTVPVVTLAGTGIIAGISPGRGLPFVIGVTFPLVIVYLLKRFQLHKHPALIRNAQRVSLFIAIVVTLCSSYFVATQGYTPLNLLSHNRLLIWKETIPVIMKSPWFGYGAGTFAKIFNRYRSVVIGDAFPAQDPLLNSHNEILELTFEYGITGIVLLGLFFIYSISSGLRYNKKDRYRTDLTFFCGLSCLNCFLFAQFVSVSHLIYCTCFSWIAFALFIKNNRNPNTISLHSPLSRQLVLLVAIGCVMTTLLITRYNGNTFRSALYVERAFKYHHPELARDTISQLIEKALQCNPRNNAAYLQRAYLKILDKEYSAAFEDYATVERNDPYYMNLHYYKGVLYYQQHDYTNAISMFLEAVRLYPRNAEAVLYLTKLYYAGNNYEQSSVWCSHLLRLDPLNSEYSNLHNTIITRKNNWDLLDTNP